MAFDIATGQRPTGASAAALDLYETVLAGHQCFIGEPVRGLRAAVADSPDFVMAQVFLGYLHAAGTDAAPAHLGCDERDRLVVALQRAWRAASAEDSFCGRMPVG